MARLIPRPSRIEACGNLPKVIEEFVGRVNSAHAQVSIARMTSPAGWCEPGQTPDFDEFTLVLQGSLHVATREAEFEVAAGQAFHAAAGEWIRYSTPAEGGAVYLAVCVPAFSPHSVHRDPPAN